MKKTLYTLGVATYTLGVATLLLTGVSASSFATGSGAQPSQSTTEVQTGSQQLATPATGNQAPASSYSMSTPSGANVNTGPGSAYHPTQTNPDPAHPTLANPSGGGGSNDSGK